MSDPDRLVEVKAGHEGSGYLIAPRLILTAWHVVAPSAGRDPNEPIDVRLFRDRHRRNDFGQPEAEPRADLRPARRIWPNSDPGPDQDFALLVTDWPTAPDDDPISWMSLPRSGQITVQGQGFPDANIFSRRWYNIFAKPAARERDTRDVEGTVATGSNLMQRERYNGGAFDVVIRGEDRPETKEGWEGMSGSALFAGGHLVGVVRDVAEVRENHRLRALPVERLFTRDDVRQAIAKAGLTMPGRVQPDLVGLVFDPINCLHLLDRNGICTDTLVKLDAWSMAEPLFLAFRGSETDEVRRFLQRLSEIELRQYGLEFLVKPLEWPGDASLEIGQERLKRMLKTELVTDPKLQRTPLTTEDVCLAVPEHTVPLVHCVIDTELFEAVAGQVELLAWWRKFWREVAAEGPKAVVVIVFEDPRPPLACCTDPALKECLGKAGRPPAALPAGVEPAWQLVSPPSLIEPPDIPRWLDFARGQNPNWADAIRALAPRLDVAFGGPDVLPRGLRCVKLAMPTLLDRINGR